MQFERITDNQVKITFTYEELNEWGLMKGNQWKDSYQWHDALFNMLDEVEDQIGIQFCGDITVEIFSLKTNGMMFIVTLDEQDELFDDIFYPLQAWKCDHHEEVLFIFNDIEEVIQLAHELLSRSYAGGSLYKMGNHYFLYMKKLNISMRNQLIAIMTEFGVPSSMSIHFLKEYGNLIIEDEAIDVLTRYFK